MTYHVSSFMALVRGDWGIHPIVVFFRATYLSETFLPLVFNIESEITLNSMEPVDFYLVYSAFVNT